jgi:hypothetical protein
MNKINFYLESRLASVKKQAEKWVKHNPGGAYKSALNHHVKYGRKGWIQYDTPNQYSEAGDLMAYNLNSFDFMAIQDLSRRAFDYSGYYADNFQHELIKPYIVKIKTSRGVLIAPAVAYSDCDIATVYFSSAELVEKGGDIDAAAFDRARVADSIAERLAEQSRDDDAKYQAEQQSEDLRAENQQALKDARALIAAIRDQRAIGAIVAPICDALISEIRGLRAAVHRNNQRINKLAADYWLAVN